MTLNIYWKTVYQCGIASQSEKLPEKYKFKRVWFSVDDDDDDEDDYYDDGDELFLWCGCQAKGV